ncbi:Eco57I restriction-modification methylase domain-containing protein [Haloplanus sp. GCM10025708]|uniref:Eco57I restriction-modification methylase domain-containing protein n=1 Tax=Haloplanus sp. GCM10025708 TaxID=3252679 RepID=UPI00361D979C
MFYGRRVTLSTHGTTGQSRTRTPRRRRRVAPRAGRGQRQIPAGPAGLDDGPDDAPDRSADDRRLVEAIELEGVDGESWGEAVEQYVAGVGYTVVNRLAALRCLEVRDFIGEEVTVFKDNGLTPAAETLVHEEFLLEDEAIRRAYHDACDDLADEIGILFDRSSAYSLLEPDDDTLEALCRLLDDVPDELWRADDVLGWVYEYYNRPVVEALDAKNALEPEDVGPANQFYTPHWVVRMLGDNSLGKLYLEATGRESSIPDPADRGVDARKGRPVTPEDAPDVPELCTYLLPDDADGDAPSFDHPSDLRVIDPACGSGHFLLYAFDVLERIWWAETDLDRAEIPAKILEHNLYGVDIDLRSCQLAAFNLYLKGRTRAEAEGADGFDMPSLGVVCGRPRRRNRSGRRRPRRRRRRRDGRPRRARRCRRGVPAGRGAGEPARRPGGALRGAHGRPDGRPGVGRRRSAHAERLPARPPGGRRGADGGLVRGAEPPELPESAGRVDPGVRRRVDEPPYGARGRMPDDVQAYVREQYSYTSEYYVNFFEACDRLVKSDGRIGMLVPWSFMFNRSFQGFREDFVGDRGSFDFFAEFGYDVLDNATVGTVGTVVRSDAEGDRRGRSSGSPTWRKRRKNGRFCGPPSGATTPTSTGCSPATSRSSARSRARR